MLKNCLLCLNIYHNLTGQKTNLAKYTIFLPSWFNNKIGRSISKILGIPLGNFPFNYLGAPISPKRLPVNNFNFLTNRVKTTINSWNHSAISSAGRSILINSSIFAIPIYYLSVFYIPDSTLDLISKLARNFLWGRTSNRSGFDIVGWNVTTLSKSEGGLGLPNLRHVKVSLVAKNVLALLNSDDKIWVSIFKSKYENWSIWNKTDYPNSSWFFKSICKNAELLKHNFKILSCNPTCCTDLWLDPCLMDLPISLKPTFLNMDFSFENIGFDDLISNGSLNLDGLTFLFGSQLDWDWIKRIIFDRSSKNSWIWGPISLKVSLAHAIYNHLNQLEYSQDSWNGWQKTWRLPVIPRIRFFIWKMILGKLPTSAYLYNINVGPLILCPFCSLEPETTDHIIWQCSKIQICRNDLLTSLGLANNFMNTISSCDWITNPIDAWVGDSFAKSLIATTGWYIWKERCFLIFQNKLPILGAITRKAWTQVTNHFKTLKFSNREYFLTSSSSNSFVITVHTDASWVSDTEFSGLGFIITSYNNSILLAGASGHRADSPILAEIAAIHFALEHCISNGWNPISLFSDCLGALQAIQNPSSVVAWRFNNDVQRLKDLILQCPDLSRESGAREHNSVSDELASFGRRNPNLSLFHKGIDRPRWIDNLCKFHHLYF